MEKFNEGAEFTVLESKTIGRNISIYRKIRDIKASDMADRIGMKETTYTKYERGETEITISFIQKVAEILNVDPVAMLTVHPGNYINIGQGVGNNSPVGINGYYNNQTVDEEQTKIMLNLMQSVLAISQRLIETIDKNNAKQ